MNIPKSKHPKTYDVDFLDIILNDVSSETGISVEKLLSGDKHKEVVLAKQLFVRLAKEFVKTDLITIGIVLNKTHATIIHSNEKFEDSHFTNVEFRKLYKHMAENLDIKRSFQIKGLYRCETCAGPNVQSMAMLNLNNGKVEQLDSKFCMDCKCETKVYKIDIVGWSSWSAREFHKLQVEGSSPSPATKELVTA